MLGDVPGDGATSEETGLTVLPEVRGDWFVQWQDPPLIPPLTPSRSGSTVPACPLPGGAGGGIVPAGCLPVAGAGGG